MSNELIMLLIGSAIGLICSMVGIILNHFLSLHSQKKKYEYDIKFMEQKKKFDDGEKIRDYLAYQERCKIAERLKKGEPVITVPGGKLACFTNRMKVRLSDNTDKEIVLCKIGDEILSINEHGQKEIIKVADVVKEKVNRYMIINDFLEITESHCIQTSYGLIKASDLRLGDYLVTAENETIEVISLILNKKATDVTNLSIDRKQNMIIIEGILCYDYLSKMSYGE